MKKIILPLVLLTVLALSVVPALATPTAQLNDLARYFPADTPVFIASSIDTAYFETLDGLLARVAEIAPPGAIPITSISDALDMALADGLPGKTFSGDIRPWLGDTLAIGVLDIPMDEPLSSRGALRRLNPGNGDAPFIMALAINDRAAATNFITSAMAANNSPAKQTEGDGFTLLEDPSDDETALVIRDDVILLSNQRDRLVKGGLPDGSLQGNPAFADAFNNLPETDYNLTIYADVSPFIDEALASDPEAAATMGALMPLFNSIGPVTMGGTILDNTSLILDGAMTFDPATYAEVGLPSIFTLAPFDPGFAAHVPANAPLAIFGTSLNLQFENMLASFNMQADALGEEVEDMQEGLEQAQGAFTEFTGLDLQEDVFGWMTGNYALFIALNPELNTSSAFGVFATVPADFGFAVEATDPVKAAALVEGLTQGLERSIAAFGGSDDETEIAVTQETIVGASTTVITIKAEGAPWPIELLMGANGEVFALGTRNAVQAIFARDGGLPANAAYQQAGNYLLANAYSVTYLGTEGLLPLADLMEAFGEDNNQMLMMAGVARDVLGLINSMSTSSSVDADGTTRGRFVLSLSE